MKLLTRIMRFSLLSLGLIYPASAFAAGQSTLPIGDVNADGVFNIADISLTLKAYVEKNPLLLNRPDLADVSPDPSGDPRGFGDGLIKAQDLNRLLRGLTQIQTLPVDQRIGQPTVIELTSPANGESDVAVTRETFLKLSKPLALNAVITDQAVYAMFGGQKLPALLHVSEDRKTITLFYKNDLPASARVRVTVNGSLLPDVNNNAVDANGDGQVGGVGTFDFDTLTLTTLPGTIVYGRVFASHYIAGDNEPVNEPLAGVTVTVDGKEETLRTVTDPNGDFRLDPAPVGKFFVHINGQTAVNGVPPGGYYPVVGKQWESKVGEETQIPNIYLPLIAPGTLQPVSNSQPTLITPPDSVIEADPAMAGVQIMVPAGALINEDGTKGGMVGIAPVPPDRIPSPLPPGLDLPLVITVQSNGTNFDQPVPVCFPNLPDPKTGVLLKPGDKSALWSFNHDTGKWEIRGPMTVSADGKLVCSDPGVGIWAPGWGGVAPGTQILCKPKQPCQDPIGQWNSGMEASRQFVDFSFNGVSLSGEAVSSIFGKAVFENNALALFAATGFAKNLYDCTTGDILFGCVGSVTQVGSVIPSPLAPIFRVTNLGLTFIQGFQQLKELSQRIDNASTLPPCNSISGLQSTSRKNGALFLQSEQQGEISNLVDQLNEKIKHQTTDFLRMQELAGIIRDFASKANLSDPRLGLSETELQLFRNALKEYYSLGTGIDQEGIFIGDIRNLVQRVLSLSQNFTSESPTNNGNYYVSLETGNILTRDHTLGTLTLDRPMSSDTLIRIKLYDAKTKAVGTWSGVTNAAGTQTNIGDLVLSPVNPQDVDMDGLSDEAETIIGTDMKNPDTDGDGITDGAEVDQGTDPLDGKPTKTGIIASVDTPGNAQDIAAFNDLAVIADGDTGVTVFNVFNAMEPKIVAQVDTPGTAQAVAFTSNLIAVADGPEGLAIIDMADPPSAHVIHQVDLRGYAQAVTTAGSIAYVALSDGRLTSVDLSTGIVLDETTLPAGGANSLALSGDYLYALSQSVLNVLAIGGELTLVGAASSPGGVSQHVFVGGGIAYAVHSNGYNTFDLSDPIHPAMIAAGSTSQFGWNQLVANGSGLGVAVTGAVQGSRNLSLYDLKNPALNNQFLTTFTMPSNAAAVSVYNGLAYAATGSTGMQVVNYLAYDNKGIAPTISLWTNFGARQAEEGKVMRITANVSDDVQVRNVEFYYDVNNDGAIDPTTERVATDGNFPFEYRFVTPLLKDRASFRIKARASDTGGNFTWTDELVYNLVPDATPPRIKRVTPSNGAVLGTVTTLTATFNEPINLNTLDASFQLFSAGADGIPGNADDAQMVGGAYTYQSEAQTAFLTFASALPPGLYQAILGAPLADLAGNVIAAPFVWTFRVFSLADLDQDGVPDDLEGPVLKGYNPNDNDSNHNGTLDGDEDYDRDGLSNRGEIVMGTDPTKPDTDGDGVKDGVEDRDGDFVSDGDETRKGTNPFLVDSDNDGVSDPDEIAMGTDPLMAGSLPPDLAISDSVSFLNAVVGADPTQAKFAASESVSFLNAIQAAQDQETFEASEPASFLNSLIQGLEPDWFEASLVVSYRTQP
jgi:hypothetical protein